MQSNGSGSTSGAGAGRLRSRCVRLTTINMASSCERADGAPYGCERASCHALILASQTINRGAAGAQEMELPLDAAALEKPTAEIVRPIYEALVTTFLGVTRRAA